MQGKPCRWSDLSCALTQTGAPAAGKRAPCTGSSAAADADSTSLKKEKPGRDRSRSKALKGQRGVTESVRSVRRCAPLASFLQSLPAVNSDVEQGRAPLTCSEIRK